MYYKYHLPVYCLPFDFLYGSFMRTIFLVLIWSNSGVFFPLICVFFVCLFKLNPPKDSLLYFLLILKSVFFLASFYF